MIGVASELEPEWMILTWPRPMHFEHTAVDDHPGLSGSRTKLSVSILTDLVHYIRISVRGHICIEIEYAPFLGTN